MKDERGKFVYSQQYGGLIADKRLAKVGTRLILIYSQKQLQKQLGVLVQGKRVIYLRDCH